MYAYLIYIYIYIYIYILLVNIIYLKYMLLLHNKLTGSAHKKCNDYK